MNRSEKSHAPPYIDEKASLQYFFFAEVILLSYQFAAIFAERFYVMHQLKVR